MLFFLWLNATKCSGAVAGSQNNSKACSRISLSHPPAQAASIRNHCKFLACSAKLEKIIYWNISFHKWNLLVCVVNLNNWNYVCCRDVPDEAGLITGIKSELSGLKAGAVSSFVWLF